MSALATLGVVAVGAVNAILFRWSLPCCASLNRYRGHAWKFWARSKVFPGLHSLERHEGGQEVPGVLLFRFNAPITFFNEPYFKRELSRAVDEAGPNLRHVVLDLLPVTNIDATGLLALTELARGP